MRGLSGTGLSGRGGQTDQSTRSDVLREAVAQLDEARLVLGLVEDAHKLLHAGRQAEIVRVLACGRLRVGPTGRRTRTS